MSLVGKSELDSFLLSLLCAIGVLVRSPENKKVVFRIKQDGQRRPYSLVSMKCFLFRNKNQQNFFVWKNHNIAETGGHLAIQFDQDFWGVRFGAEFFLESKLVQSINP